MSDTRTYIHPDDHPATLRFLTALFERKLANDPVGLAAIGFRVDAPGAWVDWDQLTSSWLSSTEKALVHVARGCFTLEYAGGPEPRMSGPLRDLAAAVTPDVILPPGWGGTNDYATKD